MPPLRAITFLFAFCFAAGCVTPKAHEDPKTTQELRHVLQDFHMKMRWGLWEQAAQYTTDNYRNEFLGRYEELGEDYKIVELNVKTVTLGEPVSTVEIAQEWYVEPDMTVQKKRFVESWVFLAGGWRINERITKAEFRERQAGDRQRGAENPERETNDPERDTGDSEGLADENEQ